MPDPYGSNQSESFLYIDLETNPHPFPIPSVLDYASGIMMTPTTTASACKKKIIRIGYDGPVKDFCGCMPSYGCSDDCGSCSELNNVDFFVRGHIGHHPMLDIQIPWVNIPVGQNLPALAQ